MSFKDRLRKIDQTPIGKNYALTFGKYNGWTIQKILYNDPSYILFLDKEVMKVDQVIVDKAQSAVDIMKEERAILERNAHGFMDQFY
jgi:hypothetical protein